MKVYFFKLSTLFVLLLLMGCKRKYLDPNVVSATLNNMKISTWMYQIQYLDEASNIDKLADTEYDMLVVEPGFNFKTAVYDTPYLVSKLKNKPNGSERLLIAYIDIGQAEDYRTYWDSNWVAPTSASIGSPDFLVTIDPDGWSGNYPVAYWDTTWQNLWIGNGGIIEQITNFGFSGVYLDWVEAYDDPKVIEKAQADGVNAELEMMTFIENIKNKGKSLNSSFLVISQNAPYLLDADPTYYVSIIDAIATEDTWYYGEGDADWDSDKAGGLKGGERHDGEYSTSNRIAQNKKYLDLGVPVFTIDYCISKYNL
jgi:cysteinyl-tRNA synthetase